MEAVVGRGRRKDEKGSVEGKGLGMEEGVRREEEDGIEGRV